MRKIAALAMSVIAMSVASSAHGALLDLIPQRPDVSVSAVRVQYNVVQGLLTITGAPNLVTYPNGTTQQLTGNNTQRSFTLMANIFNNGQGQLVFQSGTLDVRGNIDGVAGAEQLLLSSTPLAFGFGDGKLEFAFANNSPLAAFGVGQTVGVIVSNPTGLAGFAFQRTIDVSNGVADAFVPEPGAMALMAPAMALLGRRRRQA